MNPGCPVEAIHDPILEGLLGDSPCRDLGPVDRAIMLEGRIQEALNDQNQVKDLDKALCDLTVAEQENALLEEENEVFKTLYLACVNWRFASDADGKFYSEADDVAKKLQAAIDVARKAQ